VQCGEGNTNSPELSSLKILPLAYHHSHFLAATLAMAFLGPHPFFTARLFWIRLFFLENKPLNFNLGKRTVDNTWAVQRLHVHHNVI